MRPRPASRPWTGCSQTGAPSTARRSTLTSWSGTARGSPPGTGSTGEWGRPAHPGRREKAQPGQAPPGAERVGWALRQRQRAGPQSELALRAGGAGSGRENAACHVGV